MTTRMQPGALPDGTDQPGIDRAIARVLLGGTLIGMVLLAIGVALMAANDISPNELAFPPFEPEAVPGQLLALDPAGFLWAGIVVLIATPIARVVGELIAFQAVRDRRMIAIAVGILVVVALSVAAALIAEGL